ncbi:thiolase family protein [Cupriavidus sp. WGlv3]|uniref:thiolase family protein n=1 Tax=Cupriavidus sp. WGlv3 TaxID=2919924 RepID=UPI00209112FA|nr:thiolase family protein [Cupriavidus sp. WGlv3]MCO4861269.1 thiolase family protein [Cupriavidus sp. WGlv3]
MNGSLLKQRAVYVIGIGLHPYQFPSETPYLQLGLAAVREALRDAGLAWPQVQSAFVGTAALGMAAGRVMLRHLGSTGLEVAQVENASASGSTAFRLACLQVASGERDVVLAAGVDKFGDGRRAVLKDGLPPLSPSANVPLVKFALLARRCMRERGLKQQDLAAVAVKNHGNASRNPNAQFRKPRTIEQVLSSPKIAGDLTAMQCCPRGEGAAAVIVVSDEAIRRLGLARSRAVRVLSSVASSEELAQDAPALVELVRKSSAEALAQAGVGASELDIVELHDAFTIEELLYSEAIGVCAPGESAAFLARGASGVGGECAINPSGGLIGMGHPLGPTGVGQVAEITRQLRGEAQGRQHQGARLGLAHMIGLGSVAVAHVLARQ